MAFENLTVEAPDFDRIRKDSGIHTADAVRLLWYAINDTRSQVRKVQAQLQWVDVPYNAANFSSTVGTWTVESADQHLYKYALYGDIMLIWVRLVATTTTGAPNTLNVKIPRGLIAPALIGPLGAVVWFSATANGMGHVATDVSVPDHLVLIRDSAGTTWPNVTDLNIGFTAMFQVQQV